jgi:DNA polymerase-4
VEIIVSHLKSHGRLLWEYANGIDDSTVAAAPSEAKGIGNSITLPKDVTVETEAFHYLLALSDSVAGRLRKAGQLAGMISVEIKYSSFKTASHQMTLTNPTNISQVIYDASCRLFLELWNGSPVRLLGVRSSKLADTSEPSQLSLFDLGTSSLFSADSLLPADSVAESVHLHRAKDSYATQRTSGSYATQRTSGSYATKNSPASPSREKLAALDKTLDAIRQKYGSSAVVRGSFLKDD